MSRRCSPPHTPHVCRYYSPTVTKAIFDEQLEGTEHDLAVALATLAGIFFLQTASADQVSVNTPAGGGFVPTPTGSELRNPHLSYAVQWFSFAALLALFVALLSFPRRPEKDPAP